MIRVLFICHGNICRSPMAEYVFKDVVRKNPKINDDEFYIASAATSYEEIGNPVYPMAKAELAKHGIGCSGHAARKLVKADFTEFDYLVAMEDYNLRNIRREFGQELASQVSLLLDYTDTPGDIDDPWYTRDFGKTYREIKAGCEGLLYHIEKIK